MHAPDTPPDVALALRELADTLEGYPVASADAAALASFAGERVRSLLASLPTRQKVHCARCRRDVATEVGRQHFMN
jgi:hypothetical protein